MTLTEFLLARIAEDEERAEVGALYPGQHTGWLNAVVGGSYVGFSDRFTPDRVLAECEAKRRIVERCAESESQNYAWVSGQRFGRPEGVEDLRAIIRDLASVYADHPDYSDEWRP